MAVCVVAKAEACTTGQALLQKKYMVSVHDSERQDGSFGGGKNSLDTLYRLLEDDPHSALNAGQTAGCALMQGRSGLDRVFSSFFWSNYCLFWLPAFELAWAFCNVTVSVVVPRAVTWLNHGWIY